MVKIRHLPPVVLMPAVQPMRMFFNDDDRLLIDDVDYRCEKTNDDGHVLRAAHDAKIRREISHERMRIEAGKRGFRHDRYWYAAGAAIARLRADATDLSDLDFTERQVILWKEEFILRFKQLEKDEPKTVSRGAKHMPAAIERIHEEIRQRHSDVNDKGKRKYAGRLKLDYDHPPGMKALLTWIKLYDGAEGDPLVLRSRKDKSGNRLDRMEDEQIPFIRKYAGQYAAMKKPSVAGLRAAMKAEIEEIYNKDRPLEEQIAVPSYARLAREIEEMSWLEKTIGREGMDDALNLARPVGEGVKDVERPLQHVEIDHWNVGLRTLLVRAGAWNSMNRQSRRALKHVRMHLGAAICRRTHCVLAMVLSRSATTDSAIRLVEMAVSDKRRFADAAGCKTPYDIHGIMEMLWMDGGPAFNNAEIRAVLRDMNVEPQYPLAGLPHFRGMIERLFRKIDDQVLSWFEGRTFSNVVQKGAYEPDERGGTTIDELGRVLVRFVVDRHHNTPMKELNWQTPRECYLRLAKTRGVRGVPGSSQLRNYFGKDIDRVLTPEGIRFMGVQYRSRELHAHFLQVGGVKVKCRVHHANMGAISVKIGEAYLTVPTRKEFEGVDVDTWIAAEFALRAKGRHMEEHVTGEIINQAILDARRVAEIGLKRAGIEFEPTTRRQMLLAEKSMRIFADFPEEEDNDDVAPAVPSQNVYGTAVKVAGTGQAGELGGRTGGAAGREAALPAAALSEEKATGGASTAEVRPKAASKTKAPKKSPRRPGLKRSWSAKD